MTDSRIELGDAEPRRRRRPGRGRRVGVLAAGAATLALAVPVASALADKIPALNADPERASLLNTAHHNAEVLTKQLQQYRGIARPLKPEITHLTLWQCALTYRDGSIGYPIILASTPSNGGEVTAVLGQISGDWKSGPAVTVIEDVDMSTACDPVAPGVPVGQLRVEANLVYVPKIDRFALVAVDAANQPVPISDKSGDFILPGFYETDVNSANA